MYSLSLTWSTRDFICNSNVKWRKKLKYSENMESDLQMTYRCGRINSGNNGVHLWRSFDYLSRWWCIGGVKQRKLQHGVTWLLWLLLHNVCTGLLCFMPSRSVVMAMTWSVHVAGGGRRYDNIATVKQHDRNRPRSIRSIVCPAYKVTDVSHACHF